MIGTIQGVGARAATAALAGAVTLMMLVACSSASTVGDSSTGADQACTASARATCRKMDTCTLGTLKTLYGSVSACESRAKTRCLDVLAAPSTGATASKVQACAQAYADYACADYRNKANIPAPCQEAKGNLADGTACAYPSQCESSYCAIAPGNACGICSAPPGEGDSCATLTSCGQTRTCATATLKCVTHGAQGDTCAPGKPCGAGLGCLASGSGGGTCNQAGAELGVTCDPNGKTAPPCDGVLGLFCDTVTQKCARETYGAGGESCGYDSTAGTLVDCTSGACIGADAAAKKLGTCHARAEDDGTCTLFVGGASTPDQGCVAPARCVVTSGSSSKCVVTKAASCL